MEGQKKNPDRLNTIGIVTVGGVGSALVYLSIVGLQAFYVNDTSKVDELAKFGAQEETRKTLKAEQRGNILEPRAKGVAGPTNTPVYSIPIDVAKGLVVRDAKVDPANLVPAIGRSEVGTVVPVFGRPQNLPAPPPTPPPAGADVPTAPASPTDPATPPTGTTPAGATPTAAAAGAAPAAAGAAPAAAGAAPAAGVTPAPPPAAATPTPAPARPPAPPAANPR